MTKNSHRINLLTPQEINDLYTIHKFTKLDREVFFDLDESERKFVNTKASINKTKATLVFQLGYFKASGLFFDNIIFDEYSDDFKC